MSFRSIEAIYDYLMAAPSEVSSGVLIGRAKGAYQHMREPRVLFADAEGQTVFHAACNCWCSVFRVQSTQLIQHPARVGIPLSKELLLDSAQKSSAAAIARKAAFDILFVPADVELIRRVRLIFSKSFPATTVMGFAWGPFAEKNAASLTEAKLPVMTARIMCDAAKADKVYAAALGLEGMKRLAHPSPIVGKDRGAEAQRTSHISHGQFESARIFGWEGVQPLLAGVNFSFKAVLNHTGIAFIRTPQQHSSVSSGGLTYRDDSAGNALAALFSAGRAEVRLHRGFSDEAVKNIVALLAATPPLREFVVSCDWYYGGSLIRPRDPRQ